ncbi:hypothetical protein C8R45DRAFT_1038667, partial [Mycena sanguinolenta]
MLNPKHLLACALVPVISFASANPTKPFASSGIDPAPADGTTFAVYPGWQIVGEALTTILGGTELGCMESCSATATCIAYVYSPYGTSEGTLGPPTCFLAPGLDLSSFQIGTTDFSTGLIGACGTVVPG